jgi:hypothetical protein
VPHSAAQRQRLQAEVARTALARVHATTSIQYSAEVRKYFDWCGQQGRSLTFTTTNLCAYGQWYVAGFGSTKVHAWQTLASKLSALADHATMHDMPFPHKRTEQRRFLNRWLQGLRARFPHVPVQDLALTLILLKELGVVLGIRSRADLYRVDAHILVLWTRMLLMHDAFLRSCATVYGMQLRDMDPRSDHFRVTVGRRAAERKHKDADRGRRIVPVEVLDSHLSGGACVRALIATVHQGAKPEAVFLPRISAGGRIYSTCVPWKQFRQQVATLCVRAGVAGRIGPSSFRGGGATDAFAIDASYLWVKAQGGWESSAFERYIRPTLAQRRHVGAIYAGRALRRLRICAA